MCDIKFKQWDCNFQFGYYDNDTLAIRLVTFDEEMEIYVPVLTATVNLSHVKSMPDDFVLIKNWSENEGILEVLVKEDWVEDTETTFKTGFVEANLCIITPKLKKKIEQWKNNS